MDLIRWAITKPVSVTVGMILLVMFGLIGLRSIPIQLTPSVDAPVITITTSWPGRSPEEIVDEIAQEQEKRLKNVPNLRNMTSTSSEGQCEVSLEFYLNADINRALQEVSDSLREVPAYPEEVDQPVIKAAEGSAQNAIAWIMVDLDDAGRAAFPDFDISTLFDAVDKEVRPAVERIEGVAECNIYGGREREVRVLLDPIKLAQRGLSHLDIIRALRAENRNTSAGSIAEGKRDYRIRVLGQFTRAEDVLDTIVAYRAAESTSSSAVETQPSTMLAGSEGTLKPVYVRDIGEVEFGHAKVRAFVRSRGVPCLAMNVVRKGNANSMEIMRELRARLAEIQTDLMPKLHPLAGPHLRIRQVYDETVYIQSAIDLVKNNLWEGGILASIVLLIFLRSIVSTGLVAIAIPLSVIGSFLVLLLAGRTLNVISLAGLAFSVGMGIDNAIVVLENIDRRRKLGDPPMQAAYRGAREVWGAILASTLTNVAVFIPIITIREEAGQLFRDIALAATASVFISLFVAITVLPSAAARLLRRDNPRNPRSAFGRARTVWHDLFGLARLLAALTRRFATFMLWLMTGWRSWTLRPAIIAGMTIISLVGAIRLMPPLDYLPAGNQNLVFGFLLLPPGYSVEQQQRIALRVEAVARPYWEADLSKPETVNALPPIQRMSFGPSTPSNPFDPVPIDNIFVVGFSGAMFAGATSQDPEQVIPVGTLLSNAMNTSPGAMGFASQTSSFGRGIGGGNTINVEIGGPDLDRVRRAAQFMATQGRPLFGFIRPDPQNYDLGQPENRIRVNQLGRQLELTPEAVGVAIRALFDGAFVDDFRLGSDTVDMVLLPRGGRLVSRDQLASLPIATPGGRIVPLDSVVDVVESSAPQSILRIEELPAVRLIISPPPGKPVAEVMQDIRDSMISPAEKAGLLDASMRVRLEGTAAKLDDVRAALFGKKPADAAPTALQRVSNSVVLGIGIAGLAAGIYALTRRRSRASVYGALAAVALAGMIALLFYNAAWQPQLLFARFVWALAVTYLLMCALYESFLYPLVIMFSVPLAVVGGFLGLSIVHHYTRATPTIPTQNLDVLTMLGFVILVGIVVNNAILLVEQAINLMHPERLGDIAKDEKPLPPLEAIAESIRTRVRPIFMSTLTSVCGTIPLAAYPGAGSEMYRGMGAVLIGGQLVSTLFTLILVPLAFSLLVDLQAGFRSTFLPSAGKQALSVNAFPAPATLPGA